MHRVGIKLSSTLTARRAQLPVGSTIPRQMGLAYIRKIADLVSKPIEAAAFLSGFCLASCLLLSLLELLPWLPSTRTLKL